MKEDGYASRVLALLALGGAAMFRYISHYHQPIECGELPEPRQPEAFDPYKTEGATPQSTVEPRRIGGFDPREVELLKKAGIL